MSYFSDFKIVNIQKSFVDFDVHSLTPCYSLEYISSGCMRLEINGRLSPILRAPFIFWNMPDKKYRYIQPPGTSREQIWIDFTGKRPKRMIEMINSLHPNGYMKINDRIVFDTIYERLQNLYGTRNHPSFQRHAALELEQLIVAVIDDNLTPNDINSRILQAAEKIRNAPLWNWQPQALAKGCFVSYSSFRKTFKLLTGYAPYDYILLCRMQYGANLLRSSENISIKEAAELCGFSDTASFSRIFKKQIGLSPLAYKKHLGQRGR